MYENGFLEKCILSIYLIITQDFYDSIIAYVSLCITFTYNEKDNIPIIWLYLVKLPPDGKELADKGFKFLDLFAYFNQVQYS